MYSFGEQTIFKTTYLEHPIESGDQNPSPKLFFCFFNFASMFSNFDIW